MTKADMRHSKIRVRKKWEDATGQQWSVCSVCLGKLDLLLSSITFYRQMSQSITASWRKYINKTITWTKNCSFCLSFSPISCCNLFYCSIYNMESRAFFTLVQRFLNTCFNILIRIDAIRHPWILFSIT